MRRFLLYIILICLFSCTSTYNSNYSKKQYILNEDIEIVAAYDKFDGRFTPSIEVINKSLARIAVFIDTQSSSYQNGQYAFIRNNLNKYYIQFAGIIRNNKKVLLCNFIYNDDEKYFDYENKYFRIFGGGSRYWNIEVDIETYNCQNIWINAPF